MDQSAEEGTVNKRLAGFALLGLVLAVVVGYASTALGIPAWARTAPALIGYVGDGMVRIVTGAAVLFWVLFVAALGGFDWYGD